MRFHGVGTLAWILVALTAVTVAVVCARPSAPASKVRNHPPVVEIPGSPASLAAGAVGASREPLAEGPRAQREVSAGMVGKITCLVLFNLVVALIFLAPRWIPLVRGSQGAVRVMAVDDALRPQPDNRVYPDTRWILIMVRGPDSKAGQPRLVAQLRLWGPGLRRFRLRAESKSVAPAEFAFKVERASVVLDSPGLWWGRVVFEGAPPRTLCWVWFRVLNRADLIADLQVSDLKLVVADATGLHEDAVVGEDAGGVIPAGRIRPRRFNGGKYGGMRVDLDLVRRRPMGADRLAQVSAPLDFTTGTMDVRAFEFPLDALPGPGDFAFEFRVEGRVVGRIPFRVVGWAEVAKALRLEPFAILGEDAQGRVTPIEGESIPVGQHVRALPEFVVRAQGPVPRRVRLSTVIVQNGVVKESVGTFEVGGTKHRCAPIELPSPRAGDAPAGVDVALVLAGNWVLARRRLTVVCPAPVFCDAEGSLRPSVSVPEGYFDRAYENILRSARS